MTARVFDDRLCELGEGPLWHPEREQLFWFDIMGNVMRSRDASGPKEWRFDERHSAAGWVDARTLLLASETGLWRFDIDTSARDLIAPLEADQPATRSNDGRADPFGGFWIGTMGKSAETGAGAIYRFFDGRVELLYPDISIPNSICFSPDGHFAYFADTPTQKIMRQELDASGWPTGAPEVFVDLAPEGVFPDGAITDAQGFLWNAQWGAYRVARYSSAGAFMSATEFPAAQVSCPAFGGPDLTTLFATTAHEDMATPGPKDGLIFAVEAAGQGRAEPRVILP